MKAEPLIIAWSPPELAMLGPDGRLLRRRLAPDEEPARALGELWPAEFPEDGVGRLLLASAEPAALRRFCAAARRGGGRIVGAWRWPCSGPELSDGELAEQMSAGCAGEDLLARKRWTLPAHLATGRARAWAAAGLALALLGAAAWHVQEEARRSRRTAAEEAERELEAAQAAAGLRRRESAEQDAKLLQELTPPRWPIHELLLALSRAATPAIVLDQVQAQAGSVRIRFRILESAPDAAAAVHFPDALLGALQGRGVNAGLAGGESKESVRLTLSPQPPGGGGIEERIAALPPVGLLERTAAGWKRFWLVTEAGDSALSDAAIQRSYVLEAADKSRAAWASLLALTDDIERLPGAAIDSLAVSADGSDSGAFAGVRLTAKVLFLRR